LIARWKAHGRLSICVNLTYFTIYYGSGVMRQNVYSSAVFTRGSTSLHSNFTWTGSSPINHSWHQKTRDNGLPDGEDGIPLHSLILSQYRSVMDRETDGRICRSTYSSCNVSFAVCCKKLKATGCILMSWSSLQALRFW